MISSIGYGRRHLYEGLNMRSERGAGSDQRGAAQGSRRREAEDEYNR